MRGLLRGLVTRAYFPGEHTNSTDPILNLVPADQRGTLMMQQSAKRASLLFWKIQMQGDAETVFLEF